MSGRYAGRTAVILGGTHGMGDATAALLRAEGAEVLVTGRRAGDVHVDLARLADLDALARAVQERFGQIDLLHVNAGYARL